jgi:hypothetical protein
MALHSYPLSYLSYLLTDQALLYILKNYACAFNERKPDGY